MDKEEKLEIEKYVDDFIQGLLSACTELSRREVRRKSLREKFVDSFRKNFVKLRLCFRTTKTESGRR